MKRKLIDIDEETENKLKILAKESKRNLKNYIENLLHKHVQKVERTKGKSDI